MSERGFGQRPLTRLCALLVVVLASCEPSVHDRERQSAAQVLRAEQAVRSADNADKQRLLPFFAMPCFGQEPCDVQRRCREAYALHVDALRLTQVAKQTFADGKSAEAAGLLGSAEHKLQQARSQVADCTDRASALRRRYHL